MITGRSTRTPCGVRPLRRLLPQVAGYLHVRAQEARLASAEQTMFNLPSLPLATLGRYRHYKGGEYEVIGVARRSESLELMVV